MNWFKTISGVALLSLAAVAAHAQAAPSDAGAAAAKLPPLLQKVGFDPELNAQIPLDLPFRDETGKAVQLKDYFGQRPVVLALVYYNCPMLCNQVEDGVAGSLKMLSYNPGKDYEVVFISFDKRETPDVAADRKKAVVGHFNRPETNSSWHFLTGPQSSIDAVTNAASFHYTYDAKNDLFAHASGILLLTPDGRISRYFYGVEYPSRDMRLGLIDASQGKIGSPIDHVLLYCFHYDPSSATYSASILKIMRLGGVVTIVGIVLGILIFRRRDHHEPPRPDSQGAH
jgi:protein SCO1